jgi:hypothetical protein
VFVSQFELFNLYCILTALSDACPELRICEERITSYKRIRKWDDVYSSDPASFDEVSKEFILLTETHPRRYGK